MNIRNEYPNPQFERNDYKILNGEWDFIFDDKNIGKKQGYYKKFPTDHLNIIVPFCFQSEQSGINIQDKHDYLWYRKYVEVEEGKYLLTFGAIDYYSEIYIDGQLIEIHEGGSTPIKCELDLSEGKHEIVVYVNDPTYDEQIPRGKQFWEDKSRGIWYTRTSGIWQSVWIEKISDIYIKDFSVDTNVDTGIVTYDVEINKFEDNHELLVEVYFKDKLFYKSLQSVNSINTKFIIDMYKNRIFDMPFHNSGKDSLCWSPENPNLFDVKFKVIKKDSVIDNVKTYFGLRKVSSENQMTYLNNNLYFMKLVLDQGYFKGGLLTAVSDEDYVRDIKLMKEMGFNGCRKHQKVEDPRFLYWADKLGLLVWGEIGSSPVFTNLSVERNMKEWFEIIKRDRNHPSIVAWVPLNESWGVTNIKFDKSQQDFSLALYYMIKALDNSRFVVNNDGWEITKSDICAIHNYAHGDKNEYKLRELFKETLKTKEMLLSSRSAGKPVYAQGFKNEGEPILLTEFGGIAYDHENPQGWGYSSVNSSKELLEEYRRIMDCIHDSDVIYGYCYTQLTDVEQEVNGLLTFDRKPKCDLKKIKEINDMHIGCKVVVE